MITGAFVVVALFNFGDFPVFTDLVGVAEDSFRAFELLDDYDYEKVIASKYEMTITENLHSLKREFGTRSTTGKSYYEEHRHFTYRVKGEEEKYPVDVIFTIYEA